MDKKTIRNRFAEFVGAETIDRFMDSLHNKPTCRTRLFHWQEKLWDDFRSRYQIEELSHDRILELFAYCHRHDRDLKEGIPDETKSYHDRKREQGTHFLREAYRRVAARYFPFAAHEEIAIETAQPARSRHCTRCCDELQGYRNKAHHATMTLADYDKYVCDMEAESVAIYDRLGEDSGVGRLEGLALYFFERRVTERATDPALTGLAATLDETGRGLLCAADLMLDEAPLNSLRAFVEGETITIDAGKNLEKLKELFDLQVGNAADRRILRECRWLYIALNEFHRESS